MRLFQYFISGPDCCGFWQVNIPQFGNETSRQILLWYFDYK